MPNPSLPLPTQTIQAVWGDNVVTRIVPVYQNATTRNAALPTPEDGQLSYLLDEDQLQVRVAGTLWIPVGVGTFVQVGGDSMDGPLLGADGSQSAPQFGFASRPDTGIYKEAINEVGIAAGGEASLLITPVQLRSSHGALALPAYSFIGDTDTGMYRQGVNALGLVAGGQRAARINTSGVYIELGLYGTDSSWSTTGDAPNAAISTSDYRVRRSTSARKYKTNIQPADDLADLALDPVTFHRDDDDDDFIGFIADDIPDERGIVRDEAGEVENYDVRAVVAILAAKVNRLTDQLEVLRGTLN